MGDGGTGGGGGGGVKSSGKGIRGGCFSVDLEWKILDLTVQ